MIKRMIFILSFLVILSFVLELRTDGFITSNIYFKLPEQTQDPIVDDFTEIDKALSQPYRYLAKGTQFYVFESQDGKYVIKFLRENHTPKLWVHLLKFPTFLDLYRKREVLYRKEKCQKTINGCHVAFEKMKNRVGILGLFFTHNINKCLTIFDKIGHKFKVDLSKAHFVIQKKAEMMLDQALTFAYQEKDQEKVVEIIDSFLEHISYRCKKNICNSDPNVFRNFGIINDRAVEIDFGNFFENDTPLRPPLFYHEMTRYTKAFQKWINKNMPSFQSYVEKRVEKELDLYTQDFEKATL